MRKTSVIAWCVVLVAVLAVPSLAGVTTYGFENGRWGFNSSYGDMIFGPFANFFYIENSDGKPAPCLRMKSIHGVGLDVERPEFKGDFKAAGYQRISVDMKVTSMFPSPNNPDPKPQIFIRGALGVVPWAKDAQGYSGTVGQWQKIYADFDPNWTDAEAQAHGWNLPSSLSGPTRSFKETLADVYSSGVWFRVSSVGSEIHVRFDNYTLGPAAHIAQPIAQPLKMQKPAIMKRKAPPTLKKQ